MKSRAQKIAELKGKLDAKMKERQGVQQSLNAVGNRLSLLIDMVQQVEGRYLYLKTEAQVVSLNEARELRIMLEQGKVGWKSTREAFNKLQVQLRALDEEVRSMAGLLRTLEGDVAGEVIPIERASHKRD